MWRFQHPLVSYAAAWLVCLAACDDDPDTTTRRDASVIVRRDASTKLVDASDGDRGRGVAGQIDAGTQADLDASSSVDDAVRCIGPLPVMTIHDAEQGLEQAPDWSCYDASDAGTAQGDGGSRSATFTERMPP